ncbi:MAG TPA: DUF6600 domain-containing protein [Usitatibacter sp.]|nr:DUF6600 domain-containing protein [Usitatibacter sp.]
MSLWIVACGIATLTAVVAAAEPPTRVARLSDTRGAVSFSPAGDSEWFGAVLNRPLTTGDRLWVDADSEAELQVGNASIRLGHDSNLTVLNLDDNIVQLELSQGAMKVRLRHLGPGQSFEVDTPNLALFMDTDGSFRLNVDPGADATTVILQAGRGAVYAGAASYAVDSRQAYRFYGTDLSDYDRVGSTADYLDFYARDRNQREDRSVSARYVSTDVVGYEDLDANGTWRTDPSYGSVWIPSRVESGWSPYRDGHWAWIDPWGWTWVDDAPWGYTVSHYGRWANIGGSWAWVPGPKREQAVYAPALVAFVGGATSTAVVGWFPLAPREVYQPAYPVSRGYFEKINRSNTVVNNTTITNVYNITNTTVVNNAPSATKVVYANQQVRGAVIAVPTQAFAQSRPVAKAVVPMPVTSAPVTHVAAVAPVQQSLHGGSAAATAPPAAAAQRPVVAHTAPPRPPVAFAAQQQQLAAKPGVPIDEASRTQLKSTAAPAAPAPKVNVLTTAKAPAPNAAPPATPPAPKSPEARKTEAAKGNAPAASPAKSDNANAEAAKAEAAKAAAAEAAKADAAKASAAKADAAKADAAREDAARNEAAKASAAKADAAKADAARSEAARADAARAEAAKAAAAKADAAKGDAARAEAARNEAAKAAAAKADAARADAARAEAAKADAARADNARRAEAARAEAAKAEAAKAQAARTDAAKADAARADAARRNEAAKVEAAKAEAARAEAAKASRPKPEPAKPEAAKGEPAKGKPESKKTEEEKKAEEARKP